MKLKKLLAGLAIAASAVAAAPASAAVIQLGFILDSSGSIGSGNWATIRSGLADAIQNHIPIGGPDTYEVTVVTFSSTASVIVSPTLISTSGDRTAVAALVSAAPFLNANTNFALAFSTMQTALGTSQNSPAFSYVNFATDGQPNEGGGDAGGVTGRNNLIAAGVDNISIEAIGTGIDATYLKGSICYPTPCDDVAPYDFPAKGFYISVANADAYADAITLKLRTITGSAPEPGTLALLGLGLAGLAASRRRQSAK